jgi:hypothetical protein
MSVKNGVQRFIDAFVFPPEFEGIDHTPEGLASLNGRGCLIYHERNGHKKSVTPTVRYVGLDEIEGVRTVVVAVSLVTLFEREVNELHWTTKDGWQLHYYPLDNEQTDEPDVINIHFELLHARSRP